MSKYKLNCINTSSKIVECENFVIDGSGNAIFYIGNINVAFYPHNNIASIDIILPSEPTKQELRKQKFKILLEKQNIFIRIYDKIKEQIKKLK